MNLKSNKAITLVALIITIIVLLILAGVSLSMVLGENGLINKAQSSVNKYQESSENEQNLLNKVEEYFDLLNRKEGEIELSATSGECTYPNTITFDVIKNTSGGELSVSSSNTNVATVSVSGNTITVTPKNVNGTATITVKSAATGNYEEKNAMYTVTVKCSNGVATNVENYGKIVTNYTSESSDKWILYYQDSNNVYLRSEKTASFPRGVYTSSLLDNEVGAVCDMLCSEFAQYRKSIDSTLMGFKETAAMLDHKNWDGTNKNKEPSNQYYYNFKDLSKSNMIKFVIGAAPIDLFLKAMHAKQPEMTERLTISIAAEGYTISGDVYRYSWKNVNNVYETTEMFPSVEPEAYLTAGTLLAIPNQKIIGGLFSSSGGGPTGGSKWAYMYNFNATNLPSSSPYAYGPVNSTKPIVCLDASKYTPTFE